LGGYWGGMAWVANVGEAEAEKREPDLLTVVVSITEPGRKARLRKGWSDMLRLEFQDYDPAPREIEGSAIIMPPRKVPDNAILCTRSQAARIARFVRKHRDKNILVHCAAGISRSGAVVDAILQAFPEYEDRGWPRHPNGHVRSLTKRALGLVPLGA